VVSGVLISCVGILTNWISSNPKSLYIPTAAFCIWGSWMIFSAVHTYVSRQEAQKSLVEKQNFDAPKSSPLVIELPPADVAPQPTEEPKIMNPIINSGSGSINTINQSGGSNTINNLAPSSRRLSDQDMSDMTAKLKAAAGYMIDIVFMGDNETQNFAQQVISCIDKSGIIPIGVSQVVAGTGRAPENIEIWVGDPTNPPPIALALSQSFTKLHFKWRFFRAREFTGLEESFTRLEIGSQSNQ
jgi:hypothetical protein